VLRCIRTEAKAAIGRNAEWVPGVQRIQRGATRSSFSSGKPTPMVSGLKREIGLTSLFCLAAGAMVSSGIFVLPGLAFARAGPGIVVSYILAGALAGFGMLNAAELVTAMPRAGGDYFFISRTLGPAAGTAAGVLNWFSLSLKSALALVGIGAYAQTLTGIDARLTGLALCAVFVGLNLAGARHAGRAQVVFVLLLLGLMGGFAAVGLPQVRPSRFEPFAPHGVRSLPATAGFVFVAYGGLIKIAAVAGEVHDPGRLLPRAMFLALGAIVVLYAFMVLVTVGVLDASKLSGSLTPITDAARMFAGRWGAAALGVGAMLAFVSTANAGIMAASRYLYALGHDQFLPARLAYLSPRRRTPAVAIVITGAFMAATLFLQIDLLVEAASLALILSFMVAAVCVIVLRESRVQNYRPTFRAPFYPGPQIVTIFGSAFLLFEIGSEAFIICTVLLSAALTGYWLYGRRQARREYALLHLIQRITAKELVTGALERELREIVRERESIVADRFDHIVSRCVVLDLDDGVSAEECFRLAADGLAPRLNMSSEDLTERLRQRERESSTVLSPFLAVPHIVLPGEDMFEMALVRARKGVDFGLQGKSIKALFVLAGTQDQRNFHLRTLAAVAQIVQAEDFEQRWLRANGVQGIRDVVLLGRRLRGD